MVQTDAQTITISCYTIFNCYEANHPQFKIEELSVPSHQVSHQEIIPVRRVHQTCQVQLKKTRGQETRRTRCYGYQPKKGLLQVLPVIVHGKEIVVVTAH